MAELFDNICRTLATPMPRSRALKLILGGLAGAVLAPSAFGDVCSEDSPNRCGKTPSGQFACCSNGQHCCLNNPQGTSKPVCCPPSQVCDTVNEACEKPSQKQP